MKYLLMIMTIIMLAGCSDDADNGEVIVVGNDSRQDSVENDTSNEEGLREYTVTETEGEDAGDDAVTEVSGDDFSINNLEPNAVAVTVK